MSSGKRYYCMQLHANFWYAEFHNDQAIRQFVNLFEQIVDVFEKHGGGAACWDFETQLTLNILKDAGGDFLERLNSLIRSGKHDVIPGTWASTLATHHDKDEFLVNFEKSTDRINDTFTRVAPTWISQDGSFAPQFVDFMKSRGMEYVLVDRRVLNRHYKGQYPLQHRFRPVHVSGIEESLPCMFFGIEGLNSYGDFATAFEKQVNRIDASEYWELDHLIYPFVDAERLHPPRLDKWLTRIENLGGEYITPSQFLKLHPPPSPAEATFSFDVGDWHDRFFHNDIFKDQRLWTAVEKARAKIQEAEWWLAELSRAANGTDDQGLKNRFQGEITLAREECILAQSSDKSHWYACTHKLSVGMRYAVAAYERAAYACGILSRVMARKGIMVQDRPQSMKSHDLNLTVLNPFSPSQVYPKHFPVSIGFPYIIVVNLSTSPAYRIQFPAGDMAPVDAPTLFNIIPGMDIHNHHTEVFFQLEHQLQRGGIIPIELAHLDREIDIETPRDHQLQNGIFEVMVDDAGNIHSISDMQNGTKFGGGNGDEAPLLSPRFECHISGAAFQKFSIVDETQDMHHSLTFLRRSKETDGGHRLDLSTTIRMFPDFRGILVDSLAAIKGPVPGYFCPFELQWDPLVSITRDVIGKPRDTLRLDNKQVFMNDWAIARSPNRAMGIA
ncbi:hypothetical protein GF325_07475, partial [Candidatus Bathyarchaeota archaeon]|nr:hypothetical protein [Candidatus Bathyarchaeota archaeon]